MTTGCCACYFVASAGLFFHNLQLAFCYGSVASRTCLPEHASLLPIAEAQQLVKVSAAE